MCRDLCFNRLLHHDSSSSNSRDSGEVLGLYSVRGVKSAQSFFGETFANTPAGLKMKSIVTSVIVLGFFTYTSFGVTDGSDLVHFIILTYSFASLLDI